MKDMESTKNDNIKIGRRIYDLRIENDTQQGELSKAIGMHQSVLNRIEKGTRQIRDTELIAIAMYFNVCTDYLLGLTQNKDGSSHKKTTSTVTPLIRQWKLNDVEAKLLDTFRSLDERGKTAVLDTAAREYDYIFQKEEAVSS